MQRRVFAPLNPRKMLLMAKSNMKRKLEDNTNVESLSPDLPSADGLAPPSNRQQLSSPGVTVLFRDERRDVVLGEICLPRPQSGNLVYFVPEAINAVNTLARSNTRHPPCLYFATIKEQMVNEKRVPVKRYWKKKGKETYHLSPQSMIPPCCWSRRIVAFWTMHHW